MDINIYLNGNEITSHVISYTRESDLCSGVGKLTSLELDKSFTTTVNTYDQLVIYEEGIKRATFNVESVEKNIETKVTTLSGQDNSKRLNDYFIDSFSSYPEPTTSRFWISKYTSEAGITVNYGVSGQGSLVAPNVSYGVQLAGEVVSTMLSQSGWYLHFNENNEAIVNVLEKDPDDAAAIFTDETCIDEATSKDDAMLRNRAVVWGAANVYTGTWVFSDQRRQTGYETSPGDWRTVLASNSGILFNADAYSLANKMLNEFSKLTYTKTFSVVGSTPAEIGDTVECQTRLYSGFSIVTNKSVSMSRNGLVSTFTLDQRCPRIITGFSSVYVYIGTENDGVWRKSFTYPDTWSNYSSGLSVTDLNITDLKIFDGTFVCIGGYKVYTRTTTTGWSLLNPGLFTDGLNPEISLSYLDMPAVGVAIDRNSGRMYALYAHKEYHKSWIVEFSHTGTIYRKWLLYEEGGKQVYGTDIDTFGERLIVTGHFAHTDPLYYDNKSPWFQYLPGGWKENRTASQTLVAGDYFQYYEPITHQTILTGPYPVKPFRMGNNVCTIVTHYVSGYTEVQMLLVVLNRYSFTNPEDDLVLLHSWTAAEWEALNGVELGNVWADDLGNVYLILGTDQDGSGALTKYKINSDGTLTTMASMVGTLNKSSQYGSAWGSKYAKNMGGQLEIYDFGDVVSQIIDIPEVTNVQWFGDYVTGMKFDSTVDSGTHTGTLSAFVYDTKNSEMLTSVEDKEVYQIDSTFFKRLDEPSLDARYYGEAVYGANFNPETKKLNVLVTAFSNKSVDADFNDGEKLFYEVDPSEDDIIPTQDVFPDINQTNLDTPYYDYENTGAGATDRYKTQSGTYKKDFSGAFYAVMGGFQSMDSKTITDAWVTYTRISTSTIGMYAHSGYTTETNGITEYTQELPGSLLAYLYNLDFAPTYVDSGENLLYLWYSVPNSIPPGAGVYCVSFGPDSLYYNTEAGWMTAIVYGNEAHIIDTGGVGPRKLEISQDAPIVTYAMNLDDPILDGYTWWTSGGDIPAPSGEHMDSLRISFAPSQEYFYGLTSDALQSIIYSGATIYTTNDVRTQYSVPGENIVFTPSGIESGAEYEYLFMALSSGVYYTEIDALNTFGHLEIPGSVHKFETSNYSNYRFAAGLQHFYQFVPEWSSEFSESSVGMPSSDVTIIRVDDLL